MSVAQSTTSASCSTTAPSHVSTDEEDAFVLPFVPGPAPAPDAAASAAATATADAAAKRADTNRSKWINDIFPRWPADRNSRTVQRLCWEGIPSSVRGKAWSLIIGNDLKITPELYDILHERAAAARAMEIAAMAEAEAEARALVTASESTQQQQQQQDGEGGGTQCASSEVKDLTLSTSSSSPGTVASHSPFISPLAAASPMSGPAGAAVLAGSASGDGVMRPRSSSMTAGSFLSPTSPSSPFSSSSSSLSVRGRERSIVLIDRDIPRTFPELKIFDADGPLHAPLRDVLDAYVFYRPDLGYVQGMTFLAGMLLLNMDTESAFCALANLLAQDLNFSFFRMHVSDEMNVYLRALHKLLASSIPAVGKHLDEIGVAPAMYAFPWFMTMFSRALSLDAAHRVWDNFLYHGRVFLFRTAIGVMKVLQPRLLQGSFDSVVELLRHAPSEMDVEVLFSAIDKVSISEKQLAKALAEAEAAEKAKDAAKR